MDAIHIEKYSFKPKKVFMDFARHTWEKGFYSNNRILF